MLNTDVNTQNGFTSYYVKVYNTNTGSSAVMLQPVLKDGVISSPKLPDNGSLDGHELGVPFTTPAVVNTKNVVGFPTMPPCSSLNAPGVLWPSRV